MGGWRAVRTRDGIGLRGKKFYCPRRTLRETINNASPSTVNVLRSMQTPLTRGLFCLLRSSSTTLGANISSAWIMARGYFGIFRAGRASGCMCYSPSLLSTLLTKMPNSGKILHSCAHLETHTRIHLVWDARVHNSEEFLCFPWNGMEYDPVTFHVETHLGLPKKTITTNGYCWVSACRGFF